MELYLVNTSKGTKYYKKLENAKRKFYEDPKAHTLAKYNDPFWIVLSEKNFGKPEPIRVKMNNRERHICTKCKKKKESKYMDQYGPKWCCRNCNDENRAYGRHGWRQTKVDQYGPQN